MNAFLKAGLIVLYNGLKTIMSRLPRANVRFFHSLVVSSQYWLTVCSVSNFSSCSFIYISFQHHTGHINGITSLKSVSTVLYNFVLISLVLVLWMCIADNDICIVFFVEFRHTGELKIIETHFFVCFIILTKMDIHHVCNLSYTEFHKHSCNIYSLIVFIIYSWTHFARGSNHIPILTFIKSTGCVVEGNLSVMCNCL